MKETNIPNIIRDDSGALLNTDMGALISYKKKKNHQKQINLLETRINKMSCDVEIIKASLNNIEQIFMKSVSKG